MMTGTVNAVGEAMLLLDVGKDSGQGETVEAVVDTGFTGFLTLPQPVVGSLALSLLGSAPATLADGSIAALDVYEALVIWHGRARSVECLAAGSVPLAGMALLYGSELRAQVIQGGDVEIRELSSTGTVR